MRKLALFIVLIVSGLMVSAQNSKVQSALNYIKPQYNQLDKAKEAIDLAVKHPKTETKAKTWRVCGDVYYAIAQSKDENFQGLSDNPLQVAFDAYKKAIELDDKNRETNRVKLQMINLGILFINKGIEGFNTKNYPSAYSAFVNSLAIDAIVDPTKVDTGIIFNAGVAADLGKDYDNAMKYYKQTIEYGYEGTKPVYYLANIYKTQGDTNLYIATVKDGVEKFPNDNGQLILELVNYYLAAEKTDEAMLYIDKAIEGDAKNHSLYFAKGTLYDKLKDEENAMAAYSKAIEIKADYFDAYYNLGAIYYNRGAEAIKAANEIPPSKQKEYEEAVKSAVAELAKAMPYLEKAHEIDPKEKSTVQTLKEIYFKLRNDKPEYMDKYKAMNELLQTM
jgi:tetratricopeptide (TPR) repeat protein